MNFGKKMSSFKFWSIIAVTILFICGCKINATIDRNQPPVAKAGEDQTIPFNGEPVTVTLDGSGSSDPDGKIEAYIWLSADLAAEGGRSGPDPDDVVSPSVTLGQGTWTFTLWVKDDEGSVSDPDSVVITVGSGDMDGGTNPPAGDGSTGDGSTTGDGG